MSSLLSEKSAAPTHWWHPDLDPNNSSSTSSDTHHVTASSSTASSWESVEALCLGTGRFLRAVLVPILTRHGTVNSTILVQPRGRSFLDALLIQQQQQEQNPGSSPKSHSGYEVDTVLRDGTVETNAFPVAGVFSWTDNTTSQAFYDECLPRVAHHLRILGVGVTEAGLASPETPIMQALFQCLQRLQQLRSQRSSTSPLTLDKICVVDMDNVPQNGTTLLRHMQTLADKDPAMLHFLNTQMVFMDTMVDRITGQSEGSHGIVPRAEPVPAKALVVVDPHNDLPHWMTSPPVQQPSLGLVIRTQPAQLQADIALKLRIANGTHTALAHLMALLQCPMTDLLATANGTTSSNNHNHNSTTTATNDKDQASLPAILRQYIQALVRDQILPAANKVASPAEAQAAWDDWYQRLTHAHFGLSTFFITQNGAAKGGIRLGPTIVDLIQSTTGSNHNKQENGPVTVTMAFAVAVLLRWLTPASATTTGRVYKGWFPAPLLSDDATVTYADSLCYNLQQGWYEFKCACTVPDLENNGNNNKSRNLADWLATLRQSLAAPTVYQTVVRAYLVAPEGGNLSPVANTAAFEDLCQATAVLYARMVTDDDLHDMLREMMHAQGPYAEKWSTPCSALCTQGGSNSRVVSSDPLASAPVVHKEPLFSSHGRDSRPSTASRDTERTPLLATTDAPGEESMAQSYSAATDEEDYTMEDWNDDNDDDEEEDIDEEEGNQGNQSCGGKVCAAVKSACVIIANVENLWDSPPDPNQQRTQPSTRRKWIVLLWFVVLATSYAGERSTFKLLVDRAGPFRLFAVEMVTATHAVLLGISMVAYYFATRKPTNRSRTGASSLRTPEAPSGQTLSDYSDKPLGLGIPIVDVILMALLDVVNLILVFLTGIYVPPTLTVILVQFLLPLTVFLTQFSHPDGRCSCTRGSGGGATSAPVEERPYTTVLPGWGGLSANHLWGSLIILIAVVLAMMPAFYSIADPSFFVYADAIPLRTAYNSLLFVSACIPAAASQLYKEHVFLYYKQPTDLPLLNLVLSIFQFLFASVLLPLVFGLQGLGAKTHEDWTTLYPNTDFSRNFLDGLHCFLQPGDSSDLSDWPEEAECSLTLFLTFLNAFSIIAVSAAVDRIVNAGATKVMYRGISAGIILAVVCMQIYDSNIPDFSYGPFVDGLNLICALLLILGSEVYHRVSLSDSTFETVYPPMDSLYEND